MADTLNNKPKLQLGNGFVKNGAVSPVAPTKLLINHGKPNFTIQRSPKIDEQRKFPDPINTNNNNSKKSDDNVVLTNTKFYGALNNINSVAKEREAESPEPEENGHAHKVALRRTATLPPPIKSTEDNNVPEFILRQRAIQERLAKENVLDFDKRRSGYFTHVVISPTSPSPTSFAETMSSPRVNPALEIPAPQVEVKKEAETQPQIKEEEEEVVEEPREKLVEEAAKAVVEETLEKLVERPVEAAVVESPEPVVEKSAAEVDDEEVANAIEEVNKAIAGEDVDTPTQAEDESHAAQHVEETNNHEEDNTSTVHVEAKVEIIEESTLEKPKENGHKIDENNNDGDSITISHTNGLDGPHIPSPDPSGALGVNFEPKTVVSFSKDLSAGENKYPDTVHIEVNGHQEVDSELKELTKVKFDIKTDDNDIQVVPTIQTN